MLAHMPGSDQIITWPRAGWVMPWEQLWVCHHPLRLLFEVSNSCLFGRNWLHFADHSAVGCEPYCDWWPSSRNILDPPPNVEQCIQPEETLWSHHCHCIHPAGVVFPSMPAPGSYAPHWDWYGTRKHHHVTVWDEAKWGILSPKSVRIEPLRNCCSRWWWSSLVIYWPSPWADSCDEQHGTHIRERYRGWVRIVRVNRCSGWLAQDAGCMTSWYHSEWEGTVITRERTNLIPQWVRRNCGIRTYKLHYLYMKELLFYIIQ